MTEEEAIGWTRQTYGEPAVARLRALADLVTSENERQNLISPSTVPSIWSRHLMDSAQLVRLAPQGWRSWMDIGTGGGFPGMVIALLYPDREVMMIEPRTRRAEFLQACASTLRLPNAGVVASKVEAVTGHADVISARAVASVPNLVRAASQCADTNTVWLLPRGRTGKEDAACFRAGVFHVEQSLTDPASYILVGKGLAA